MLPWTKKEKMDLTISNKSIYLLVGLNDGLVDPPSAIRLKATLEQNNNSVKFETPKNLQHNSPELASSYIRKHISSRFII